MARAQDAGTSTGGQIDPYVQQSLQSSKQQSSNRLLAAMQEKGATGRAAMQETGATARNQANIQAQSQMQAAQLAAQDKRAAEQEIGRREDNKFQEMLQKQQQVFVAEQSKIKMEFEAGNTKTAQERADALQEVQWMVEREIADAQAKVTLAQIRASNASRLGQEKLISGMLDGSKQAEANRGMYEKTMAISKDDMKEDSKFRSAYAIASHADRVKSMPKYGMFGGPIEGWEAYEKKKHPVTARPGEDEVFSVLQKRAAANGFTGNIMDMLPQNIHNLKDAIASGQISKESLRSGIATLDAMTSLVSDTLDEAKDEKERAWWDNRLGDLKKMRSHVSMLTSETGTKIAPKKTSAGGASTATNYEENVGGFVKDVFGDIEGQSYGGRIRRDVEESGKTTEAAIDDYMKTLEQSQAPGRPIPIPPGTSKPLAEYLASLNRARGSVYPAEVEEPAFTIKGRGWPSLDQMGNIGLPED